MSSLWFNIRFGSRHWQWGPYGMSFKHNSAHDGLRKTDPNWSWFEVYTAFGHHFD